MEEGQVGRATTNIHERSASRVIDENERQVMVSSELYGNNQRRTYWTVIITAYHTRDNTVQQPMVDGIKHTVYWIKKGYRSIKMVSFYQDDDLPHTTRL